MPLNARESQSFPATYLQLSFNSSISDPSGAGEKKFLNPGLRAEWRKNSDLDNRLGSAGLLLNRTDLTASQKQTVINEVVAIIGAADKERRASATDDLIWYASRAKLNDAALRPAVELLVRSISEDPSFHIDDHTAMLVRSSGVSLGPADVSLQSRMALLDLEAALSGVASFTLPALDGSKVTLADFRGKVVLLNFWATWCGPCRAEKPILERVYRDLKHKDFMVLAITDEDPALVRRFAQQQQIGIPILVDQKRTVFDYYGIEALPKTVILNREGRPTARPITISDEAALRTMLASAGVERGSQPE